MRTGRGLYYTTHAIPDPEDIGPRTIDRVIGLLEEEIGRRRTGSSRRVFGHLTRQEMLLQLTASIDSRQGSASPKDDITVLVMDFEG